MKKFFLLASLTAALYITACNDASTDATGTDTKKDSTAMTQDDKEERNKKSALESVNAFLAGDADGTLKNAAADATDYFDGSMPPVKGVDSIKASLKGW